MKKIEDIRKAAPPNLLMETDLLIASVIKRDRGFILAHPEWKLNLWETVKIIRAIRQLKNGRPLAYITGHKEFFGLDFLVNKHTLIPRPDTEIMVEEALSTIKDNISNHRAFLLADIGTGSGCVAISIAKNIPEARIFAIDISKRALYVARKNAKLHKVNINFFHGDLLEPLMSARHFTIPNHLIITANLPYLTKTWVDEEQSLKYEPKNALIADIGDGLTLYDKLFKQIKTLFGNFTFDILIEIDPRQAVGAEKLAREYFADARLRIKKDLAGRDRLLIINTAVNS
jgi:release factor glutamine methyltransferase